MVNSENVRGSVATPFTSSGLRGECVKKRVESVKSDLVISIVYVLKFCSRGKYLHFAEPLIWEQRLRECGSRSPDVRAGNASR